MTNTNKNRMKIINKNMKSFIIYFKIFFMASYYFKFIHYLHFY